ncbi:MAG TPA: translation initiation factor IF-2 N-terminal domain-containing protein, partial [Myxococcales bacterium]|nr:translation initiation factor IF-2 N-terminal domain-containing protein [Myxococcales bacterium]
MAKKRVYELAKDLGLSNKEMVDWLKAHEYDVKSHSSSLEDDQAQAVTEKVLGERAPKAVAAKPSASGVVLRRKKADTLGPDGQPIGEHEAGLAAMPPPPEAAHAAVVPPPPPPHNGHVHGGHVHGAAARAEEVAEVAPPAPVAAEPPEVKVAVHAA